MDNDPSVQLPVQRSTARSAAPRTRAGRTLRPQVQALHQVLKPSRGVQGLQIDTETSLVFYLYARLMFFSTSVSANDL